MSELSFTCWTACCVQVKKILYEEEDGSSDSSHPGSASSEDEDIFEETAQVIPEWIFNSFDLSNLFTFYSYMKLVISDTCSRQVSPPRGRDKRNQWRASVPSLSVQPLGGVDWAWLVKRLYKLCMDLCNSYIQMHRDLKSSLEEAAPLSVGAGGGDHVFFLPLFQSETSTPTSVGGLSVRGTPLEDSGYRCQTGSLSPPTPSPGFRSIQLFITFQHLLYFQILWNNLKMFKSVCTAAPAVCLITLGPAARGRTRVLWKVRWGQLLTVDGGRNGGKTPATSCTRSPRTKPSASWWWSTNAGSSSSSSRQRRITSTSSWRSRVGWWWRWLVAVSREPPWTHRGPHRDLSTWWTSRVHRWGTRSAQALKFWGRKRDLDQGLPSARTTSLWRTRRPRYRYANTGDTADTGPLEHPSWSLRPAVPNLFCATDRFNRTASDSILRCDVYPTR